MKVLIAGAGGVLGRSLVQQALKRGDQVTALVLNRREMQGIEHPALNIVEADVTKPEQLRGMCEGITRVISCLGITRIKGRLTHEDVDFRGNLNLLREAERSGVGKFGFISPAGTQEGHHEVPLLAAKYRFEESLRNASLSWVIFHSGGFFSDLGEMKKMAAHGPLFVIGRGTEKSTPIHVADLAEIMLADMETHNNELVEIGGPEHLSWMDINRACFEALRKPVKIVKVPVWLCQATLTLLRPFSFKHYAMGRLLLFMSTRDVCTPLRGRTTLHDYLQTVA